MPFSALDLIKTDSDFEYETKLVESPDDIDLWIEFHKSKLRQFKETKNPEHRLYALFILQRASDLLNRSYKLFSLYIRERIEAVRDLPPLRYKALFLSVNQAFEKGLCGLHKFPKIWVRYLEFVKTFQLDNLALLQDVYLRALWTLPLTQHRMIHEVGLSIASDLEEKYFHSEKNEVARFIAPFYIKSLVSYPGLLEFVLDKLISLGCYHDAIKLFDRLILGQSDGYQLFEKSVFQLYQDYLECYIAIASQCTKGDDDRVLRIADKMLKMFPDQLGSILVTLFRYLDARGLHLEAENLLQSRIANCMTVKDFKTIYKHYLLFLERRVEARMEELGDEDDKVKGALLDMQMNEYEEAIKNSNHHIADIMIRQDRNNCAYWLRKIELYASLQDKLACFVKAIKSIDPGKAHYVEPDGDELKTLEKGSEKTTKTSGLDKIWTRYAGVYQNSGDFTTAEKIYKSAIQVPFHNTNDLVEIYYAWAEMWLANDTVDEDKGLENAIEILESAIKEPDYKALGLDPKSINYFDNKLKASVKLHKAVKLWSFYLDLIESTGDIERTINAYEKVMKQKILTPLMLINYVNFLEENGMFSKSFQVFEVGLEKFNYYPIKFELNSLYLQKLMKRFIAEKLLMDNDEQFVFIQRIRDVFEQSISDCPSNLCKKLYLLEASFEEKEGKKTKALSVYKQCIKHLHLPPEEPIPKGYLNDESIKPSGNLVANYRDIIEIYDLLLEKLEKYHGKPSTRPIYESILQNETGIPGFAVLSFAVKFAGLEESLKEFGRARAIYTFATAFVNYRISHPDFKDENIQAIKSFWEAWANFELNNGNEDTYSDMLRIQRDKRSEFD